MSMYNFDLSQQVYCLSSASNAVGSMEGTEADLQQAMGLALDKELPQVPGNWVVSWGPRVYKREPQDYGAAENVWFAAVSQSQKTVVVAVSGTAPVSVQDWLDDIDIKNVVNFDDWVTKWSTSAIPEPTIDESPDNSAHAFCAHGTARGVWNILSSPSNIPQDRNKNLNTYLSTIDPSYGVIFTGHSMGGALAPTIALGLATAEIAGTSIFYAMPSAGPSPGNNLFVDRYNARFPKTTAPGGGDQPYHVLNTDLFNTNDVVPQAWSLDTSLDRNIARISDAIYTNTLVPSWWASKLASTLVYLAKSCSSDSEIKYTPIPGTAFTGPSIMTINNLEDLYGSILSNHTADYWKFIGIDQFVDSFEDKVVDAPGVDKPTSSVKGRAEDGVVQSIEQEVRHKIMMV